MNLIERRNEAINRTRARIDAVLEQLVEDTAAANKPTQEELRSQFDAAATDRAKMDVYRAKYGEDEFYRQWNLYLKRRGGSDG